jgi:hypothetical protein
LLIVHSVSPLRRPYHRASISSRGVRS